MFRKPVSELDYAFMLETKTNQQEAKKKTAAPPAKETLNKTDLLKTIADNTKIRCNNELDYQNKQSALFLKAALAGATLDELKQSGQRFEDDAVFKALMLMIKSESVSHPELVQIKNEWDALHVKPKMSTFKSTPKKFSPARVSGAIDLLTGTSSVMDASSKTSSSGEVENFDERLFSTLRL